MTLTPNSSTIANPKKSVLKSERLPLRLQIQIWMGKLLYGKKHVQGGGSQLLMLPRDRVVKVRCHPNELEAMEFVRENTTVPVPRVFEVYEFDGQQHLVMEKARGISGSHACGQWTPEQVRTFGRDLGDCIRQLRGLEPPSEGFVGSVSLGSSLDHRLSGTRFGPFRSVADFHTYLRFGRPLEQWANKPDVHLVHSRPGAYAVKFTHADLHPNNIMVQDGRITGVVDWEFAGWYPEYWEYTKMYFSELRPRWDHFYDAIEGEPAIVKYPDEFESELTIWMRMSPFTYDHPQWKPGDDD